MKESGVKPPPSKFIRGENELDDPELRFNHSEPRASDPEQHSNGGVLEMIRGGTHLDGSEQLPARGGRRTIWGETRSSGGESASDRSELQSNEGEMESGRGEHRSGRGEIGFGRGEMRPAWGEMEFDRGEGRSRRGEIGIFGARRGFSGIYAVFKAPDRRLAAPDNAKFVSDYQNARINIDAAASHASPNQPTPAPTPATPKP